MYSISSTSFPTLRSSASAPQPSVQESKFEMKVSKLRSKYVSETKVNASMSYMENGKMKVSTATGKSAASAKSQEESEKLCQESAKEKVTKKLVDRLLDKNTNPQFQYSFSTSTESMSEPCFMERENVRIPSIQFKESNGIIFTDDVKANILCVAKGGSSIELTGAGGGGGGGAILLQNVLLQKNVWYTITMSENEVSFKQVDLKHECVAIAGQDCSGYTGGKGGHSYHNWPKEDGMLVSGFHGGDGGNGTNDINVDPVEGKSNVPKTNIYLPFLQVSINIGGGGGGSKVSSCGSAGFGKGGYGGSTCSKHEPSAVSSLDTGFGAGGGGKGGKGGSGVVLLWFDISK